MRKTIFTICSDLEFGINNSDEYTVYNLILAEPEPLQCFFIYYWRDFFIMALLFQTPFYPLDR